MRNTYPPNNNVIHAKPDLRVLLKWMINRSGSVITDVIPLGGLVGSANWKLDSDGRNCELSDFAAFRLRCAGADLAWYWSGSSRLAIR